MKKIVIFLIATAFFSCEEETTLEFCPTEDFVVDNKINGGSILQTWKLFDSRVSFPEDIIHSIDLGQKTNANWISLSPVIGINDWWGHDPPYRYEFPVSGEVEKMKVIIPKMRNSGLYNIMLKPLTAFWLVDGSSFWGDFYVDTEEEWKEIERTYEELIYGFAGLSTDFPEVKLLSIGNELREFAKRRPQFFKALIARLRADFPDLKLTYAANWDEYRSVSFWEDLDYIGVNPYFPLTDEKEPTIDDIEWAFRPIKDNLLEVSCTSNKPILFTEYGFRSSDYGLARPWDKEFYLGKDVNFTVQNNAYTAFYNTFWEENWVAGGFFWEWRVIFNGEVFSPNNNAWYVNDKPAQKIIAERYSN